MTSDKSWFAEFKDWARRPSRPEAGEQTDGQESAPIQADLSKQVPPSATRRVIQSLGEKPRPEPVPQVTIPSPEREKELFTEVPGSAESLPATRRVIQSLGDKARSKPTMIWGGSSQETAQGANLQAPNSPGKASAVEGTAQAAFSAARVQASAMPPRKRVHFSGGSEPKTFKGQDMSKASSILKRIKDENIEFVDLRFTDPKGKWQHVTFDQTMVDEDFLAEGAMFDGSSIAGWKAINESDMTLALDLDSAVVDPFMEAPTLAVFCNVLEPSTGLPYNRDPRSTALLAESYLKQTGVGDTAFFGPEAEFFIFDDVRWNTEQNDTGFQLDSSEGPYNSGKSFPGGNMGHRPGPKGGYFPVPPVDSGQDIRSQMLRVMTAMGLEPEKHHHEVAPSQHELGMRFSTLTTMADRLIMYKYIVHQVSAMNGKTATFMPKPIFGDNGSGMHVHQSIWSGGSPVFAGSSYADLSDTALYYIGGILKHAKALNAFTNPSTNSYKRLVPGYEAPVLLAYSSRNRSASCRIPHTESPKGKRMEIRFPDAMANPYLAFSAMLMAGLDGIENKIHPGDPLDKDLYSLPPEELAEVPTVSGSLREALFNLDQDRAFLTKGGVFNDDQIDAYIELKMEDVLRFETMPHPVEFDMYYSA